MRRVIGSAALAIGLLPAAAAAQQPDPAVVPAPELVQGTPAWPQTSQDLAPPQNSPYARLFKAPELREKSLRLREQLQAPSQHDFQSPPAGSHRVICGMTVIQVDPSVDPRMVIPRVDDGTRPAIRTITPPVCRE
jgi:hypothetical protein